MFSIVYTKRSLPGALLGSLLMLGGFGCSDDAKENPDAQVKKPDSAVVIDTSFDSPLPPKPKISQLIPQDGFACPIGASGKSDDCSGSIPITVIGENFGKGATVFVDGGAGYIISQVNVVSAVSLKFKLKKNPYDATKASKVSIQVSVGGQGSNLVDFQYTLVEALTDDFKGKVITKTAEAFRDFPSQIIQASVFAKGLTEGTEPSSQLKAQVGSGPVGADPNTSLGFRFFDGTLIDGSGKDDLYEARIVPALAGDYDVAFRFSKDQGKTWVYVDGNDADLAYAAADASKLKVADAPTYFCMSKEDCDSQPFRTTCNKNSDPAKWKEGRCLECLEDQDCIDNPRAIGAHCDKTKNECFCVDSNECANSIYGKTCQASKNCGCTSGDDCTAPRSSCYQDSPKEGLNGCGEPAPECFEDKDCSGNQEAVGPRCDKIKKVCFCADSSECASSIYGKTCQATGNCGCTSEADCAAPRSVCYRDNPKQGLNGCGAPTPQP